MAKAKTKAAVKQQPDEQQLTALEYAALAQVAKDAKKLRDDLRQGKGQPVDFTVRVAGAVDVGTDYKAKVNEPLDELVLIGLIIERLAQRTRNQVIKDIEDACEHWRDGGELPVVAQDALDVASELLEAAKRPAEQSRRGAVTASLSCTLVERAQRQAA